VKVLITLGPTQEPLDSIRYITTASSGKMGAALALEALRRKHSVSIVSGPVALELPAKARVLNSVTAAEMTEKTLIELEKGYDILISSAALADYTPAEKARGKIKSGSKDLSIKLKPTLKLTAQARKKFPDLYIVAFKAEYALPESELIESATNKLKRECLDLICANDIEENRFGSDTSEITIIGKNGIISRTGKGSKEKIAEKIWDIIEKEKE
jgi:phosphopantothenoylcysteine decarboxylase / phosphopantothenate---cysteine ligase